MTQQVIVRVKLFAGPAQQLGVSQLELPIPSSGDNRQLCVGDVAKQMCDQYPELASLIRQSRWAVGTDFVSDQQALTDTQVLALIPPVSGG